MLYCRHIYIGYYPRFNHVNRAQFEGICTRIFFSLGPEEGGKSYCIHNHKLYHPIHSQEGTF